MTNRDEARRRQLPPEPKGDALVEALIFLFGLALVLVVVLLAFAPETAAYLLLYWWNGLGVH